MVDKEVLLEVKDLKMHFPVFEEGILKRQIGSIKAVDGISFNVYKGETLGLVGESGCGKSTTARTILQLYKPTAGQAFFRGINLFELKHEDLRKIRSQMPMIFQDPYSSLDPRMTVGNIIAEPMVVNNIAKGSQQTARVQELLGLVGLNPSFTSRYPHEFSGGQRQRIGIARALASNPEFIICDEPISALDVSIQAQVVNLLEKLQNELGLTYIFIAHDMSMVRHISSRVAVMYLGKIVEFANRESLYNNPQHPYTKSLLSAVPIPNPKIERKRKRIILEGDIPSPENPPKGCRFHTRCPVAIERCKVDDPEFREIAPGHFAACHLVDKL
ncbi:MAG: oligopeptide/dipeptide ABC transporter ATP-binding protein [Anaerolineaceae bacterium]|jgi:oligopeptide transport system ATP-binding protein